MVLLDLAYEFGLKVKKTSNCKGGEYHSSCPGCGEGVDRFVIWPNINRYWCRQCNVKGDAIQFCRDFFKMSFYEARQKLELYIPSLCQRFIEDRISHYNKFEKISEPSELWMKKALSFVNWSHVQLLDCPDMILELQKRGFKKETILKYKLGYCKNIFSPTHDFFRERAEWGLPVETKNDGKRKMLWLPFGLVIPTPFKEDGIRKIKIRREQWHVNDELPKYVEVTGSMNCLSVYGNRLKSIALIVESEFDAMLIQQEADDICFSVALGGASKKPDFDTDQDLQKCDLILCCLDNDETGRKASMWWRKNNSNLKFWPTPIGKSPGDALRDHKIKLREWIMKGISYYKRTMNE